MNNQRLKTQMHLKQMSMHLKPRRRRLFRDKDSQPLKSKIPTLIQAQKIEQSLMTMHKRVKSKKKQQLCDLFAQNISLFCRLNKQKSIYEQLFSKNKENRETKRKLKRCTSAQVNRTRTFQQCPLRESYSLLRSKRPQSSYSSKNHRKILTIQSQF